MGATWADPDLFPPRSRTSSSSTPSTSTATRTSSARVSTTSVRRSPPRSLPRVAVADGCAHARRLAPRPLGRRDEGAPRRLQEGSPRSEAVRLHPRCFSRRRERHADAADRAASTSTPTAASRPVAGPRSRRRSPTSSPSPSGLARSTPKRHHRRLCVGRRSSRAPSPFSSFHLVLPRIPFPADQLGTSPPAHST